MYRQEWKGRKPQKKTQAADRRLVVLCVVFGVMALLGIIGLINLAAQQRASEKADAEMRELYHTETAQEASAADGSGSVEQEAAAADGSGTAGQEASAADGSGTAGQEASAADGSGTAGQETAAADGSGSAGQETAAAVSAEELLPEQPYPGNPDRTVGFRFRSLRAENKDIVGWLTIGSMLDEAVVQRNNIYYMDHNVKGKSDVSGALFLDELISLQSRPYALVIFGHNMKTGARFGCLRNYENQTFYHKYPFITFDTVYEEGQYVIFSVGNVSTRESDPHYLDFLALDSRNPEERRQAIDVLEMVSIFSNGVDVRPEDQILLLVTCVDQDEDRRVVAARRIRDGETREELQALVEKNQ